MGDEEMTEVVPVRRREEGTEVSFDDHRILRASQSEAAGEAGNVGIDDHTGDAEGVTEDDIGGLTPDAGEGGKGRKFGRNHTSMFGNQCGGTGHEVFGLVVKKPGGADQRFDRAHICGSKSGRCRIALEEGGGDLIDPDIRALRRQDGRYQQLPGRSEMQRALRLRVKVAQSDKESLRGAVNDRVGDTAEMVT